MFFANLLSISSLDSTLYILTPPITLIACTYAAFLTAGFLRLRRHADLLNRHCRAQANELAEARATLRTTTEENWSLHSQVNVLKEHVQV